MLFLAYPTCSPYLPTPYPFPYLVPLLASLVVSNLGRSSAVQLPSLLTMLTKNPHPQCFLPFSQEAYAIRSVFILFYLVLDLVFASWRPYAKIRRVFVGTQLPVDSESSSFSLCTYIYSVC